MQSPGQNARSRHILMRQSVGPQASHYKYCTHFVYVKENIQNNKDNQ